MILRSWPNWTGFISELPRSSRSVSCPLPFDSLGQVSWVRLHRFMWSVCLAWRLSDLLSPSILKLPANGSQVADLASGRTFKIVKSDSFQDTVVWNPWKDKSVKMTDFGDEEYKEMLCIEPAVAGSGPVKLGPGETWVGSQTVSCRQNKLERVSIDGAVL